MGFESLCPDEEEAGGSNPPGAALRSRSSVRQSASAGRGRGFESRPAAGNANGSSAAERSRLEL